jgi:hypothetical protein
MDVKVNNSSEAGQAFFEFILFTPFLIAIILLLIKLSAAINGSINQQKVTRGYFYSLVKNDSKLPDHAMLVQLKGQGLTSVGFYAIGWRERSEGVTPIAPCYKIDAFLGGSELGSCDEALGGETKTNYIKPVTAYGVCSTSYQIEGDEYLTNPLHGAGTIANSCALQ